MPTSGSEIERSSEPVTLEDLRKPLEEDLNRIDQIMTEQLEPDNPVLEKAVEANTTTRGKRMRPMLLLFAAESTGEIQEDHYQVAAILELIHAATLVHDDVLDQGEYRRKHLTVNEKFGNELAVLFGDFIFSNAYILTVELEDREVRARLSETARDVCKGEIWQTGNKFNYDIDESTYLEMIRLKTASLFEACGALGAKINGADHEVVEAFGRFGTNFGMAFQIVDDYLDLVGDESYVGKSLGTDLQKGKLTLPVLQLFSRMDQEERAKAIRMIEEYGQRKGEEEGDQVSSQDVQERERLRNKFTEWLSEFDLQEGHKEFAGEYLNRARQELNELAGSGSYGRIHRLIDFAQRRYW